MPGHDITPSGDGASGGPESATPKHGALGHLSADEELQQAVCSALIENSELDSSDIGVRVASETVILSGSVKSTRARRLALEVAGQQPGVAAVQADELQVQRH
jgi:osmotically-inducible protein OsmY